MKPELIIVYTWDIKGFYDNKVCGHMYEVIDYYWYLKDFFDVKIIIPENYNILDILSKYNFNENEREQIIANSLPRPKNGLIKTKKGKGLILVTDGNLGNFGGALFGKIIQFSCGRKGLDNKGMINLKWYLLDDERIREGSDNYNLISNPVRYDYNKKILFNKIKYPLEKIGNYYGLLYLTENCRKIHEESFSYLIDKYSVYGKLLILTDYMEDIDNNKIKVINIRNKPINPFEYNFLNYIYTNVDRQWDCSSRFIPECYFRGINVICEIDYLDLALKTRIIDAQTNLENLELTNDSKIIEILMEIYND